MFRRIYNLKTSKRAWIGLMCINTLNYTHYFIFVVPYQELDGVHWRHVNSKESLRNVQTEYDEQLKDVIVACSKENKNKQGI